MPVILIMQFLYSRINLKTSTLIAIVLFVGCFTGIAQGGMLAPASMVDQVAINGVEQVNSEGETYFAPLLPYRYPPAQGWWKAPQSALSKEHLKAFVENKNINSLQELIWSFESNVWNAVRVSFFSIVGLIGLGLLVANKKRLKVLEESQFGDMDINIIKYFCVTGIVCFIVGFNIVFWFIYKGHKWELSRFLMNGYTFGLISFAIAARYWIHKIRIHWLKYICLYAITILMCFGSISRSAHIMYNNCRSGSELIWNNSKDDSGSISFGRKVKIICSFSGMI
jgi:hypothetical protein